MMHNHILDCFFLQYAGFFFFFFFKVNHYSNSKSQYYVKNMHFLYLILNHKNSNPFPIQQYYHYSINIFIVLASNDSFFSSLSRCCLVSSSFSPSSLSVSLSPSATEWSKHAEHRDTSKYIYNE